MFPSLRSVNACQGGDPPGPGSASASLPSVATAEATPSAPLPPVESAPADSVPPLDGGGQPVDRKGRQGPARGGRPRLTDPRQPRGIRFSSAEWAAIADRAAAAGRDPHAFVRDAALGRRLAPPPSAANREQWLRLAPLAANLSQLAGAVNTGRVATIGDGTRDLLAAATAEVRALRLALLGVEPDLPDDQEAGP